MCVGFLTHPLAFLPVVPLARTGFAASSGGMRPSLKACHVWHRQTNRQRTTSISRQHQHRQRQTRANSAPLRFPAHRHRHRHLHCALVRGLALFSQESCVTNALDENAPKFFNDPARESIKQKHHCMNGNSMRTPHPSPKIPLCQAASSHVFIRSAGTITFRTYNTTPCPTLLLRVTPHSQPLRETHIIHIYSQKNTALLTACARKPAESRK